MLYLHKQHPTNQRNSLLQQQSESELEEYKITTAMQNEAVYWTTLVQESVPKWSLVPSLEGIYEPLVIVDQEKEDELNQEWIILSP